MVGSGPTLRFALFAAPDGVPSTLQDKCGKILEPALRKPFHDGGLWLVRPDGYVALSAKAGDWEAVENYFDKIA